MIRPSDLCIVIVFAIIANIAAVTVKHGSSNQRSSSIHGAIIAIAEQDR